MTRMMHRRDLFLALIFSLFSASSYAGSYYSGSFEAPLNTPGFGETSESIAALGEWVAVGAPDNDSVEVYKRFQMTDGRYSYAHHQTLQGPQSGARFGHAVNFRDDTYIYQQTDQYLFVGAPYQDIEYQTNVGAVHVFKLNSSTGKWAYVRHIYPYHYQSYSLFGYSIDSGWQRLMVGSPYYDKPGLADSGKVELYRIEEDGDFVRLKEITPPGGHEAGANMGWSVAMTVRYKEYWTSDIYHYIFGSPGSDQEGTNSGRADSCREIEPRDGFGYPGPGFVWHCANYRVSSVAAYDRFGADVSIGHGGRGFFAVGAPRHDVGSMKNAGAVYVGEWDQWTYYDHPSPRLDHLYTWTAFDGPNAKAQAYAEFGTSVDLLDTYSEVYGYDSGFKIVAGAPQMDQNGFINFGGAFMFERDDNGGNPPDDIHEAVDFPYYPNFDLLYHGRAVAIPSNSTEFFTTTPSSGSTNQVQQFQRFEFR